MPPPTLKIMRVRIMKPFFIKLKCPVCGAMMDEDGVDVLYCKYCGNKLRDVDASRRKDMIRLKKIQYAKDSEDKEREHERYKMEFEAKEKDKERKNNNMRGFVALGLYVLLMLFIFYMGHLEETADQRMGLVSVTMSAKDLKGKDHDDVVLMLSTDGFTNIAEEALDDLVLGWITKDGTVEKVSINGNATFESGDKFPKNSTVKFVYHTFSE